jgi:hypothetical protein
MGTGIVFEYLMIAALVAPLLWLFWWGAGSLAGRRPRAVTVAPTAVSHPVFAYPEAVDLSLPSYAGVVTVYSHAGRQLSTCNGPDSLGRCPRPAEDGTVPCSGCLLALPRPIRGSFEWQIPASYRSCLLGSYSVFRQPR